MLPPTVRFRVVYRFIPLDATRRENELQNERLTRADSTVTPRGKVLESQYNVMPNMVFLGTNADMVINGIVSQILMISQSADVLSRLKFSEAQVRMLATDHETHDQVIAAEGSARDTDIGFGGSMLGKLGGTGGLGWTNANEDISCHCIDVGCCEKSRASRTNPSSERIAAHCTHEKSQLLSRSFSAIEKLLSL